jgi:pilus assembly protein CpaB
MKNRRAILFLGLAALCGLATASVARKTGQEGPPGVPVVVASAPALPGRVIDPSQLEVVSWPAETIPQGAFSHPSALATRVLARSVVRGEPILESSLLPVGTEAGLGALIEESARAVSIKIDEFIGVAGFVQPGSRVDVIATVNDHASGSQRTEVILQNLKVLAVDVRVDRNQGSPEPAHVVTLEVSPHQAPTLTHAENQGALKLALRNPKNDAESSPVKMVLGTDVYDMRF